jgi:ABC-type antimicrobial peptide transport system permease subunit
MKKNMGAADRTIRILLAIIVGYLIISGQVGGTLAIILGIFTAAFVITGFIGWCPAYVPFGFSTKKKE